jgi:uncharacterized sporulation protein YeaH/YhbH (DUF444 family)
MHLSKNIYVFYGSDGDDWKDSNNTLINELKKLSNYVNRIGILIAKNASSSLPTTLETNLEESNILSELRDKLKLSRVNANEFTEEQIIDSIKFFLTV